MSKGKQEINSIIKINEIHPKDMTKKEWIEDFISLYEMMKENYPYFWVKERELGYNWCDLKEYYLERLEKASELNDYLTIFFETVRALQNAHTTLFLPHWLEYHYKEGSYFQINEPFKSVFCKQTKDAREYWTPIIKNYYKERYEINFEVMITYEKGDYILVEGFNEWKEKYGERSKILAVNNKQIDEAILDTYEKGNIDWDFKRKKAYVFNIRPWHFGHDATFTIKKTNDEKQDCIFKVSQEYKYDFYKIPRERLIMKTWHDKEIAYLRFQSFEEEGYMDEEHDLLISFYKHIKNYKYLIIDITGNQGGCYLPWAKNVIAPLTKKKLSSKMYLGFRQGEYANLFRELYVEKVEKIVDKAKFKFLPPEVLTDDFSVYDYKYEVKHSNEIDNFEAKIILLTDKITFSATDAFAIFCKETGFATLYGTPTGGDGISESPIFYALPNSKLIVRYQPGMGIMHTGHASEEDRVHPDVFFEGNLDELIDYVLKQLADNEK